MIQVHGPFSDSLSFHCIHASPAQPECMYTYVPIEAREEFQERRGEEVESGGRVSPTRVISVNPDEVHREV